MRRVLQALLCVVALAACAERHALFVVMPNADGSVGAITVDDGKKPILLDHAYAASEIRGGAGAPVEVKPEEADSVFAKAIAARPSLPRHFRLYFVLNSDKLVPQSETAYAEFLEEVKRRPKEAVEVEVIGHTDTLGTLADNQALSLKRAEAIRDRLVKGGLEVDRSKIKVAGRGQLDLLVKTADQVAEPQNRRVEIEVR